MYRVLYRKYRPLTFEDVIGQEHIVATVKNQIIGNKISHAYMFTGTRGTGKTTCAKILARAVNCENPVDGNPCNECKTCRGILDGSLMDVYEIDAASNNGVDNIRELREDVIFTPALAKYKVYIIDEVHMLSTQAFNALLKTLEEPPAHVIFIFATTEINKVPPTILSRCQRFDFRRITVQDIKKRLMQVCKSENIRLEDNAAMLISKLADGAMRDALSVLDRCANGNQTVTLEVVEQTVGLCAYEQIATALNAVADGDTEAILRFYTDYRRASKDAVSLFSELCTYLRDMMVIKLTKSPGEYLEYDEDKLESIKDITGRFTLENIVRAISVLQSGIYDVSKYKDKHIMAEMTLIKLTNPQIGGDIQDINARLSALETSGFSPKKPEKAQSPKKAVEVPDKKPVPKPKPYSDNADIKDKFIDMLQSMGGIHLTGFLPAFDIKLSGNTVYIACPTSDFAYSLLSAPESTELMQKAASAVSGVECAVRFAEPQVNDNQNTDDVLGELLESAGEILQKE